MNSTTEPRRTRVLVTVWSLLFLPVLIALIGAASFNFDNRNNGSLVSSGEQREYLLYVPRSYDPERLTPLVISLHGGGMWGAAQRETSQWNRVADEHGFIVVYPSGTGVTRYRAWRAGEGPSRMKDVRFISDLIDALRRDYRIDPDRVYADGISNGGGMAFVLACALSDRIAAVGMVASAVLLPWEECPDDRPVPLIAFHGTADRFTRYHGGTTWVARDHVFPDFPAWIATWARRNRCGRSPFESAAAADVTRIEYENCADNAPVVLYRIEGGGHSWPGGQPLPEWFVGTTTRSIDASRLMWRFFQDHPLRPGAALRPTID